MCANHYGMVRLRDQSPFLLSVTSPQDEGYPCLRPMYTMELADDFTVYFATARDTIRRLGLQLDEAQQGAESLRRELKRTHGELERERARYGWIEANNDSQRFELERVTAERSTLVDDNRTLAQRLHVLESGTRPPAKLSSPPANATLPRATRRKLKRERRRSKPSGPPAP